MNEPFPLPPRKDNPSVDVDFVITGGASRFLLTPMTSAATQWMEDNLDCPPTYMASACIEQHRIAAVASDISINGLKVRWIW